MFGGEIAGSLSFDTLGNTYFAKGPGGTKVPVDMDIWVTQKNDFSAGKPLPKPINTDSLESQPCISADGNLLFFTTIGFTKGPQNVDIAVSRKMANGEWTVPMSVSSRINSDRYDGTPFLSRDGQTLYFSSAGHGATGEADIFYSTKVGPNDIDWSEPVHLPPPISAKGRNLCPFASPSGEIIFFSSDRDGGEGGADLYEARVDGAVWSR